MDWISKLERKYGKYAISGLMKYLIVMQIFGYFILSVRPDFYYFYLSLDVTAILQGQIWRIFTFLVFPPSTSLFYVVIAFYLYYMIGQTLESVWGAFRFNMYLLAGILFHVIAAFLAQFIFGFSSFLLSFLARLMLLILQPQLNPCHPGRDDVCRH